MEQQNSDPGRRAQSIVNCKCRLEYPADVPRITPTARPTPEQKGRPLRSFKSHMPALLALFICKRPISFCRHSHPPQLSLHTFQHSNTSYDSKGILYLCKLCSQLREGSVNIARAISYFKLLIKYGFINCEWIVTLFLHHNLFFAFSRLFSLF